MAGRVLIAFLAVVGTGACASAGTRLHEMTLVEHELAAARADDPELARQHRAAGQALRAAEETACAGLTEHDRALEPFFRPSDVESAAVLREHRDGKAPLLSGAAIVLRAASAPQAELLQRRIACHLARVAVVGEAPEFGACPLALTGVQARVRTGPAGTRVEILSSDADTADEIWRRSLSLTGDDRSGPSAGVQSATEQPPG